MYEVDFRKIPSKKSLVSHYVTQHFTVDKPFRLFSNVKFWTLRRISYTVKLKLQHMKILVRYFFDFNLA